MPSSVKSNALEALHEKVDSPGEYSGGFFLHLAEKLKEVDHEAVGRMVDIIEKAQRDNKSIFFIGNGGSAAVASHVANDLSANSLVGSERGYRAFCLADPQEEDFGGWRTRTDASFAAQAPRLEHIRTRT